VLSDVKASDFLVDTLALTSRALHKRDLFMLAAASRPEQIHPEVKRVLDAIAASMPEPLPVEVANASPSDSNGVPETDSEPDA